MQTRTATESTTSTTPCLQSVDLAKLFLEYSSSFCYVLLEFLCGLNQYSVLHPVLKEQVPIPVYQQSTTTTYVPNIQVQLLMPVPCINYK